MPSRSLRRILAAAVVLLAIGFGCNGVRTALQTPPHPPSSTDAQRRLVVADHLAEVGDQQRSQAMYRDLEQHFAATGDNRNALYAHISRLRGDLGHTNLQQLSLYLAEQLKRPDVQNDPYLKIRCLETKAAADLNLDGVSARPAFEELERTAAQVGEKRIASRASGNLGIVAFLEGNSSEAKWRVSGALASSILTHDVAAQSRYLSLFGLAALEHHAPEQALWFLNKAISIAEKNSKVVPFPEMAYIGKVGALTELSRFGEAQLCINRARDYARRNNSAGYQADLMVETAKFYVKQNRIPEAIAELEKAVKLATDINFNRGVAEATAELAALYQRIGDLRKARDCAERCVSAHQELGEVYLIPHQLAVQAAIETAAGQFAQAERTYSKAENLIKLMLGHEPSSEAKKGVINAMSEIFVAHFELAAEYENDVSHAYTTIEEARGRILADRLSDGRPKIAPKKTAVEVDAERRLELLQIRLSDSNDTRERAELSDAISTAETDLPTTDQPQPTAPIPLYALQRQLNPDELLLEYVLGPKRSYCLSITRESTTLAVLPDRNAVDALVTRYIEKVKAKGSEIQPAQALFRAAVMPIAEYRAKERLIVVPDGSLNSIPFSALRDEKGEFLVRSHEISYVPSGTAFALMRARARNTGSLLLAVGNVTYSSGEWLPRGWYRSIFRGVSELRRDLLPPLPSTDDEIQSIRSSIRGNAVILSGDAATESAFKRQAGRSWEIIHLAVHAVPDQIYPDRAALIFASEKQPGDDGLLQVREIRKLPLEHTELVTLSACDTSIGRLNGEEGVSSIVYAFLYAGAKSAVATLWLAEDTSTAAIMKSFYRHLSLGESKSQALRNAQLEFVSHGDQPPFYWASFQLVGDAAGTITAGRIAQAQESALPVSRF